MITKLESNHPFQSSADIIGAHFDVSDLYNITCRPADHYLRSYISKSTWIKKNSNKLFHSPELLSAIGSLNFCAKFLFNSRFLLNILYAFIASSRLLQCCKDLELISKEATADDITFLKLLNNNTRARILHPPSAIHPGIQG